MFQAAILLALALVIVMIGTPVAPAVAVNVTPWPTAFPLTVGTPWAPWYTATPRPIATTIRAATPTATIAARRSVRQRASARARVTATATATPTRIATPTATTAPVVAVAPLPTATPAPVIAPSPTAVRIASTGRGDSPANALEPTDTWQDLGAGARVWYVIGANSDHMDVWLDASVHGNVDLAIYAPNSSFNDPPKGRGTYTKHAHPDRLTWAGGSMAAVGNWYACVTNQNPFAIRYKLGRIQTSVNKTCHSYWEYIGTQHVYWTACE